MNVAIVIITATRPVLSTVTMTACRVKMADSVVCHWTTNHRASVYHVIKDDVTHRSSRTTTNAGAPDHCLVPTIRAGTFRPTTIRHRTTIINANPALVAAAPIPTAEFVNTGDRRRIGVATAW